MESGALTSHIDVAQVTLYAFWAFFVGLVWYLRQEDRREGYPLEADVSGEYSKDPWLFLPQPKTFVLFNNQGTKTVPDQVRDTRPIAAERLTVAPGSPLVPTGDPMADSIGPGSYAERLDIVETNPDGSNRIVPLRTTDEFQVVEDDPDPRGMSVVGCDKQIAGTVTDLWVDKSDSLIRYLEVQLEGAGTVLLPMPFCVVRTGHIYVHAVTSEQFAGVPTTASPDAVSRLEEEKIAAYYGAGQLYATPERQEPLL
ncbi:photosynthetic reaction center H subunit [Rhodobium orientis]|uniref:Photosynthetic reaction center subunit H n=1 Tax=Rhodobium orientis TaxID=34017 RepID=A0A327JSB9_9HYPH|nr:photosynthetic reaction center subunit H [Rhodobium orientis]MBB4303323.1 photosynthetic reaction center H subunit [Rhodobium orientis]MBK5951582.1 photosynthetic reaction center subunit H [Rhodobium orientis]RAI27792.1 photosynthetic reaction center subunit H [Rhodobium orientis]